MLRCPRARRRGTPSLRCHHRRRCHEHRPHDRVSVRFRQPDHLPGATAANRTRPAHASTTCRCAAAVQGHRQPEPGDGAGLRAAGWAATSAPRVATACRSRSTRTSDQHADADGAAGLQMRQPDRFMPYRRRVPRDGSSLRNMVTRLWSQKTLGRRSDAEAFMALVGDAEVKAVDRQHRSRGRARRVRRAHLFGRRRDVLRPDRLTRARGGRRLTAGAVRRSESSR